MRWLVVSISVIIVIGTIALTSCVPKPEEEVKAVETSVFGAKTPEAAQSKNDKIFKGDLYYIPTWSNLDGLGELEPQGSIYTTRLDISPRDFLEGFPGVSDRFEWFALSYTGQFEIATAGEYTFRLNSDDGSKLTIGNELIIDNDGIHSPQSISGKVNLNADTYDIKVEYFQGPQTEIALQLFVTPPLSSEEIFEIDKTY